MRNQWGNLGSKNYSSCLLILNILLTLESRFAIAADRTTTLSAPKSVYQTMPADSVEVLWGKLVARLVNNAAVPPEHAAGYNGLSFLSYDGGASPFVPQYAGLNLEHVNNGVAYEDQGLKFEPRQHPMELRKINENTYELYQAALPNTGLESSTRFTFREPYFIDVTFECIPRLQKFPYDHLNVFWASYILKPEDKSIYFMGRKKGSRTEEWIQGVTPLHGKLSTHRGMHDKRQFRHQDPFPLTLVFNESDYEYTRPFYYGRYKEFVWIVMFRKEDEIRLTQSPSGGGEGNPAWDFQWFIKKPRTNKLYRMAFRAIYKPWVDREDVLRQYKLFLKEK